MLFGTQSDEATSAAILDAYLDAGGNFLDTANIIHAKYVNRNRQCFAELVQH